MNQKSKYLQLKYGPCCIENSGIKNDLFTIFEHLTASSRRLLVNIILIIWLTGGRFEIRNFKSEKWVSMFLSYLVENFFWSFKT